MSGQPQPEQPEAAPDGAAARRIVITFPADGSTDARIEPENVTPAHLYLAAWLLDAFAREIRAGSIPPTRPGLVLADHLPPGGHRRQ